MMRAAGLEGTLSGRVPLPDGLRCGRTDLWCRTFVDPGYRSTGGTPSQCFRSPMVNSYVATSMGSLATRGDRRGSL
eukprot:scaffold6247_cov416-Prasinococcus_capsulatus_cf.AAC.10